MVTFVVSAVSLAIVFLYGCLGETLMEKAGHLNLGIPGIMCLGTAGGCLGIALYQGMLSDPSKPSWILLILFSIFFSVIFSSFGGSIYALLTVSLRCNQNITGLALTTFGSGLTQLIMDKYVDRSYFDAAGKVISRGFVNNSDAPGILKALLSYGFFVYFGIVLALAATFVLNRTRVGLHLRSIGENPATADAAGINVTLYKYLTIIVGSSIAGLGGLFYTMDYLKGSWENASTIEAFGWMAIALVIFTLWKPNVSILGSIVFGGFYIAAFVLNGSSTQKELLKLLPYVITVVVLIFTSIVKKKGSQAPAALGLSYFREER
ncbi:MAG: ABC transporter permease [Clostridia bacterium]|nr:ABC transporter permease [Clostridia bacterium]